jgi:hypothetical protein
VFVPLVAAALAADTLAPVRADGPIHVDGHLDEAAWAGAPVITGFTSASPVEGQADPGTEARLLYDDTALYVGFVVHTAAPVTAPITRRDQTLLHDWVGIVLDTYEDGQRAFTFRVTPRGVQADGIYLESDGDLWNPDLSWDGVWRAEATRTDDGYVVEIAIDWRTLRYPRAPAQTWQVILLHNVPVPWTFYTWPARDRAVASQLAQAAALGPMSPPPSRPRPELMGTVLGKWAQAPLDPGLALLDDAANPSVDVGLGARIGLGSSLTADITVNPDFSQIEADPDQVTANVKYPLYYEEKRPFFLEGADVFDTPVEVVYGRSIADPLGAAKLSGRAGPVALGVLSAFDQSPQASTIGVDYASGAALPAWGDADVEAADAQVDIVRGRYDLGDGAAAGALFTDKELLRADGSVLANRVVSVDGTLPLGRHAVGGGQLLGSYTDFASGDPTLGVAWHLDGRGSGKHLSWKLEQTHVSSGFRAETGFLDEVGRTGAKATGGLRWDDVGAFRSIQPKVEASGNLDPAGVVTDASAGPALRLHVGDRTYGEAKFLLQRERYLGVDFDGWATAGFVDVTPGPGAELYVAWDAGPEPYYDAASAAELYQGFAYGLYVEGMVTLGGRLELLYDGTARTFAPAYDAAPDEVTILQRVRATYGFSREISSRVIAEWNTYDQTLDTSALLVWEQNSGTAASIGYGQTIGPDGVSDRSVFAKLSVLWRP